MIHKERRFFLAVSVTAALWPITSGWANELNAESETALLLRARAYWTALVKQDLFAAWAFEERSLDPQASLQAYFKKNRFILKSAEVIDVAEHSGNEALVRVTIRYDVPQVFLKDYEETITDPWVWRGGSWYHKEVEPALLRK